jgi:hypothetical protein
MRAADARPRRRPGGGRPERALRAVNREVSSSLLQQKE